MSLQLVTAPVGLPVSLTEVRAQCRVADTAEDALVAGYIHAATSWAEGYLGRALITQTWQYTWDDVFPWGHRPFASITLPLGPVQSVTSIAYTDTDGVPQTMTGSPAEFELVGDTVRPFYGQHWPAARPGVVITYVAGYGDSPADVPASVRHGITMLAAYWFNQREAVTVGPDQGPASRVPYDTRELLDPHRVRSV
jgi:uncharacterized phiE125 gp8 family phage protein